MIQPVLDALCKARARGGRSVVLVPESAYGDAMKALACLYPENSGRTAWMPDGALVSVAVPSVPIAELGTGFNLYLAGWGCATPKDERRMQEWINASAHVFTEIS